MFKSINYKDLKGNYKLIDVRSPGEYNEATIPGAVNLPLFNDEERQQIGYVYVNEDVEKAKRIGIKAVSRKLPDLYDQLSSMDKEFDKLVLFCARGGMRSSSLSALLTSLGMDTYKLAGGYKGYRSFINDELPRLNEEVKFIVLHGKTGVGKTELLKCLKLNGLDILDLEEAANHRGSLLGSVGLGEGRSQKQFESIVFEELKNRKSDYIFVEAESKRVGNIIIPSYIYKNLEQGIHILVDAELDFRAKLIIDEYTSQESSKEDILKALNLLRKYISERNIQRYETLVQQGEYEEVAKELMVKYYDPMYTNGINKYEYQLSINVKNIEESCSFLKNWFEDNILTGGYYDICKSECSTE